MQTDSQPVPTNDRHAHERRQRPWSAPRLEITDIAEVTEFSITSALSALLFAS